MNICMQISNVRDKSQVFPAKPWNASTYSYQQVVEDSQKTLRSDWRKMNRVNKREETQGYLNICFKQSTLKLLIICIIFQLFPSYF